MKKKLKITNKNKIGINIIADIIDPYQHSLGFKFYAGTKLSVSDLARKSFTSKKFTNAALRAHHKTYPRLSRVALENHFSEDLLLETLTKRKSTTAFRKSLSIEEIAYLLRYGAGKKPKQKKDSFEHRVYPSAGARYPIELYLYIQKMKGIAAGIYHYNVRDHTLECLTNNEYYCKLFRGSFSKSDLKNVSAVIVMTAIFERNIVKYGERGFRHIFFECGHIAQNLYLLCARRKIGCRALGGFAEDGLIESLDIFERTEIPLYTLALGR